ncbi:cupin [Knoellia sinensis KCTC 19936]|uniref:Cupin n=1 Tax=Knoellia sinensis KCTC 19936 TaxID=1385520 RepID=A0A0A0J9T7_9MICO|nr:hypothetical protein [Knoellia sinensis]KGN34210.1 cupin [Knoellia sinensis KCTC 19936]
MSESVEGPAVDLLAVGEAMLVEAREAGRGRVTKAVVRQPGQNLILLALPAGGSLPDHEAPGPASLQCLSGEVVLSSEEGSTTLVAGTVCAIPQSTHAVTSQVDSLCLLSVSLTQP